MQHEHNYCSRPWWSILEWHGFRLWASFNRWTDTAFTTGTRYVGPTLVSLNKSNPIDIDWYFRVHNSAKNLYVNTQGEAIEDSNIQCKNITKRRARARTGRTTERKHHEMGRDGGSETSEEQRRVSQLSKVATCCTTLLPTMDKQV